MPTEEDGKDEDEFDQILFTAGYNYKPKFIMYDEIECYKSFFIISMSNPLRRLIYRIVKHPHFENVIIVLIFLSSIVLVADTYKHKEPHEITYTDILTYIFTASFAIEALLKSIAFGFVMDNNSYLRDCWNILDFILVFISIIEVFFSDETLAAFRIFRLLRALRPLRFIT